MSPHVTSPCQAAGAAGLGAVCPRPGTRPQERKLLRSGKSGSHPPQLRLPSCARHPAPVTLCPFPKARKRFSLRGSPPVVGFGQEGARALCEPCTARARPARAGAGALMAVARGRVGTASALSFARWWGPKEAQGLVSRTVSSVPGWAVSSREDLAPLGWGTLWCLQTQPGDQDPAGWLAPAPGSAACPQLSAGRGRGASSDTSFCVPIPCLGELGPCRRRDRGSRQHPGAPRGSPYPVVCLVAR